jgi:serine/threonine protein kinase/Tfp pilus assembly protein PilF
MTRARLAIEVFKQALTLDTTARTAYLDRECTDASLRDEVDALFAADAAAGDFLERPLAQQRDRSGEQLGPYRLTHLVGSGGMGSVYRAERVDGVFSRPVAIKLLLFDAGDLRLRFALEQRILGALDHQHIARLLDVGCDAHGAPYLVMEFVEGKPLTQYVEDNALAVRARIELFLNILDAVQTAHSQLVVHRDIKPGNVLVDAHGEPKLLDFGIAKLIGEQAPSATRTGLGPLTPDYASPEQVRGEPIGIGSDIYSLGVMLYEMIAGQRPYQITDRRPSAVEYTVCETDPPRPSAQLSTQRLSGSRRDLDAIVLKALEKSPRQRYLSCAAFADDLRRWLNGEQVQAREPSWPERSQRFLRRHRLAVSVAAAATLALLVGSAVALWQAHIAGLERDRAERVNQFLTDMLSAANPGELGRKATVAEVLDRAQRLAERELNGDAATTATTQLTLARTYQALGNLDAARHSGEAALAAARRGNERDVVTAAEIELGVILTQRGDFAQAEPLLRAARDAAGTARLHADAANALGSLESQRGQPVRAANWFEIALAEIPQNAIATRAETLNNLGIVKSAQGDNVGALSLQRQVVDLLRQAYPHGHPDLAEAIANLGVSLEINDQFDASAAAFAEALPMQIELLGEEHPSVVQTLASMTNLDVRRGDRAAAVEHGARAWNAAQKLPENHPLTAYAAAMYGQALMMAGRASEAVAVIERALAMRKVKYPADHPLIANTESLLGLARAQSGDIASGESLAREAYARLRAKLGDAHELTVKAKQRLAQIEALPPVPVSTRTR